MGTSKLSMISDETVPMRSSPVRDDAVIFPDTETDPEWKSCFKQISYIRSLNDDWDEAGAAKIRESIVDSAEFVLHRYRAAGAMPPTGVLPSPSGSVVIEWHEPGSYVGAEIEDPSEIQWMIRRKGYKTLHRTDTLRWVPLRPISHHTPASVTEDTSGLTQFESAAWISVA